MNARKWLLGIVVTALALGASAAEEKEATLHDAIRARTEVMLLQRDLGDLKPEVRRPMRKVIAKGDAQQMAGNILLTKDRYSEAVRAYREAGVLYRRALDGKVVLERLAEARAKVQRARMLAAASAAPEKLREAHRLVMNADGYEQAGDFEAAIAELKEARGSYEALLAPPGKPTTLEEAVAARTAMLVAKQRVRAMPDTGRGGDAAPTVERDTLPGLLTRAAAGAEAGGRSLEERDYTPARALFAQAAALYGQAAALQAKRGRVLAAQKTAQNSLALADGAFQGEARPASFERGKQALADGSQALAQEELDQAKEHFARAVEFFARARDEAAAFNAYTEAWNVWETALSAADGELLAKHVPKLLAGAKSKVKQAATVAIAGDPGAAAEGLRAAIKALAEAVAEANTREKTARAVPLVRRLEAAIRDARKFDAEDVLAQLEELIPTDPRTAVWRRQVAAVPAPPESLRVDLSDGVGIDFVLIPRGRFQMGSAEGEWNEKPVRRITFSRPFYMGTFEVTQEQWEVVMDSNPSRFRAPRNPVEQVCWHAAVEFTRRLSEMQEVTFRLPTEAEWEYACRADSASEYHWGNAFDGDYAWDKTNAGGASHEVGTRKANAWGLFDMSGNVYEWCADWYADSYPGEAEQTDPKGTARGTLRVFRGGSWCDSSEYCRSASRRRESPSFQFCTLGFRLVRTVE